MFEKINYGYDIINFKPQIERLLEITSFLLGEEYSIRSKSGKNFCYFIPNKGLHNIIEADTNQGVIKVIYTSPEGKKQTENLRNKLEELCESK